MAATPRTGSQFRRLYDANFESIRSYFLRRVPRSEVNDAMADTFLVAWRRIDDAPPEPESRLWLYGIARNVVRNADRSWQRRSRLAARMGSLERSPDPDPETVVIRRREDEQLLAVLATLRPLDQEVLRLSVWEDLTNNEIARVLGVDAHAVTMRLSRARGRMAKRLGITEGPRGHRTDPQPVGEGGEP